MDPRFLWALVAVGVVVLAAAGYYAYRRWFAPAPPADLGVITALAVDSAAKRYSMIQMGQFYTTRIMIIPDGTIAAADRQHFLSLYSGIAATVAGAVAWFWSGWKEPA